MSDEGRAYTWDEGPIYGVQEDEFVVLPEGDYPFTVSKWERARHTPKEGGKLPACPKAIVYCKIDGGPLGEVTVKNSLFLHSKCDSLNSQFFTAIGLRKHGDPLVFNWQAVTGQRGRCKVGQYKGKDGNTYNEIKKFLIDASSSQPPSQPAPQAHQMQTAAAPAHGYDPDEDIPF